MEPQNGRSREIVFILAMAINFLTGCKDGTKPQNGRIKPWKFMDMDGMNATLYTYRQGGAPSGKLLYKPP